MQDHLTNSADLAKPAQQQQGRLQYIPVQNRMRLCLEAEIANLAGNHPAKHRKAKIGPHGLRHRNPVIAGSPFHSLKTLINDHADRLVMRRVYRIAARIMRIPGPVGTA